MADLSQMASGDAVQDSVRQFREFLNQYNKMTEMCFNDCVNDFNGRTVQASESSCALNCLEKYLKSVQRISERFREIQTLSVDEQTMLKAMGK